MIICVLEDRKTSETSLKLLLLSLTKHCRDIPVRLSYPAADAAFRKWLLHCPQVALSGAAAGRSGGWNAKPRALLDLLGEGYGEVVWLDSDIIVTQDFRKHFGALDSETLVLTEEALFGAYRDPDAMRARLWGLAVGRSFPFVANTAVVRVTAHHIPLLLAWEGLLDDASYQTAQEQPWDARPTHLFGDQDVISALLTSMQFMDVPVKFLMRGADIIQYFGLSGYTCSERLRHIFRGPPAFIHSQVFKPWTKFKHPRRSENFRDLVDTLYLDLSPYTLAARRYRPLLLAQDHWMEPHSRLARLMRILGLWYSPLVGAPIAAVADFVRLTNLRFAKKMYFSLVSLRDPEHAREL
ncbi:nucleotide-diphospho-sugar transferase [Methylobacterium sp. C25]|uniref:hypothetical protein n=1 Tax=Methylobacterium sp. C25 TaxID=2721622 RepID=UPI001F48E915|nr:hypothetical protein [Methylobacterium sp. C25]MCE4225059.1 nucleotide-diphospho-sugar transferase [Methylobacterium sp. C25]